VHGCEEREREREREREKIEKEGVVVRWVRLQYVDAEHRTVAAFITAGWSMLMGEAKQRGGGETQSTAQLPLSSQQGDPC
jgi:hypothetical protein